MQEEIDRSPCDGHDSPAAAQASTPVRWTPRCPQCGGTRVRGPSRALFVNLGACAISIALTPIFRVMVLAAMVSFLVLPVTITLAAVGRHRCLDCRRRFVPGYEGTDIAVALRFPWRLYALNTLLLFLLCIVGPVVMETRAAAHPGGPPNVMAAASFVVVFGLLLWTSLVWHLVLRGWLKFRIAHPLIWTVLFLLPGLLVGGVFFCYSLPANNVRALLKRAQLAPLPESATGVRIYRWSSPFSGEDFLRFTAGPNDIERFLADSPALQGREPTRYSAQRMRLTYPDDFGTASSKPVDGAEYVRPSYSAPSWYKYEVKGPARKYHVQPPRYQLPGEVLVDDETHTVYVYLCFS